MKINFFLPVVVSAVLDDTSTLLSVSTQSKAMNLMNAVGHRNVTSMQALVQEIADESVSEPGWKFDDDIKAALQLIRDTFVKSIQKGLNDEHKNDQEHFNCFTQDCFGACNSDEDDGAETCATKGVTCTDLGEQHVKCRDTVHDKYVDMAQKCGLLHRFDIADKECKGEDCLCPDLLFCHKKNGDLECKARAGDCKGVFGNFLQGELTRYKEAHDEWSELHTDCKAAYHAFLTVDMECDTTQKDFEKCSCEKSRCDYTTCGIDFTQCTEQCWGKYDELVKEKECLERDRKIDWSATKKIECYVDVLLHDYTKEELLRKCGSEQCINKAREGDYKDCATVCRKVDHDGVWPSVLSVDPGNVRIEGHARRANQSQFLLGDGDYKCDVNGHDKVFTKHRGGIDRAGEDRCTEHLDFDFQVPECITPECKKVPVCDAAFHKLHYAKFDDVNKIGCISDVCSVDDKTCFDDVTLQSSSDGEQLTNIKVSEHSEAWAYNRCPCTECQEGYPVYSRPPENHQCGAGAHGLSEIKNAVQVPAPLKYTVNGQEYETREAQTGALVWNDRNYKFIGDIHELTGATFFFQPHKSLPAGSTWHLQNIPVGSKVFVASELTQHVGRSGGFTFDGSWTHLQDQRVRWNAVHESVDVHVTVAKSDDMKMTTNMAWVGFIAVKKP